MMSRNDVVAYEAKFKKKYAFLHQHFSYVPNHIATVYAKHITAVGSKIEIAVKSNMTYCSCMMSLQDKTHITLRNGKKHPSKSK